jgi:electron transfer flavoprotein alpha subunit
MATVRPGVMKAIKKDEIKKGEIIKINPEINEKDLKVKIKEKIPLEKKHVNLEDAELIVSCGRGVGNKEKVKLIEQLADALDAELAASRAVVDAGWVDEEHLVGQTGKNIAPKLYLTCGISGATQHTVAIKNSDTIVAINKDPNALIFKIADYCIVGNLNQVIPAIIEELNKIKK